MIEVVKYFQNGEQDFKQNINTDEERNRRWKEVWDSRTCDSNYICDCCWKEIIQYKKRNLNNAGWFSSSMNDRSGYEYRYSCEECKQFNLCFGCYEKWENENNGPNNSIHDKSHTFISHPSENKIKHNYGPAPDPRNYRRRFHL